MLQKKVLNYAKHRRKGDYDDMYNATEEEIVPYIAKTEDFLNQIKTLITVKSSK